MASDADSHLAGSAGNPLLCPFRFEVQLLWPEKKKPLCKAAFSECSGLEARLEPRTFKEGGRNDGQLHRFGQVTHGEVTLRRGMTSSRDLWTWFDAVTRGGQYQLRLQGEVVMRHADGSEALRWLLDDVLPVSFKSADLRATASEVAVEEVRLVHQGLRLARRGPGGAP